MPLEVHGQPAEGWIVMAAISHMHHCNVSVACLQLGIGGVDAWRSALHHGIFGHLC